jgi:hypothetical protein
VLGDDGGCFAAALAAVRRWGGVIEHPEGSHAWRHFGLNVPPRNGGWVVADFEGGWTCCVEQGAYGHRARKATWLYAFGVDLPSLKWGRAPGDFVRLDDGFYSAEERRRAVKTGACQRLSKKQRAATPIEFRDLLLSIARTATNPSASKSLPAVTPGVAGANCPEVRSKRPRGFFRSLSTSSALHAEEHGENPWTILSLNDPKK